MTNETVEKTSESTGTERQRRVKELMNLNRNQLMGVFGELKVKAQSDQPDAKLVQEQRSEIAQVILVKEFNLSG